MLALDHLRLGPFALSTVTLWIVPVSNVTWSLKSQLAKPVKDKRTNSEGDSPCGHLNMELLWSSACSRGSHPQIPKKLELAIPKALRR